jgi:GNAT superfamily N-acetyltransferase
MRIKRAQASDAGEAVALIRRSIAELCGADHGGDPRSLAEWLSNKTVENMREWIAQSVVAAGMEDGRIVGVAALTRTGRMTLKYVAPEFHFGGVSKALVRQLEFEAAKLCVTTIELDSTLTALQFYRSLGYRSVVGMSEEFAPAMRHPIDEAVVASQSTIHHMRTPISLAAHSR